MHMDINLDYNQPGLAVSDFPASFQWLPFREPNCEQWDGRLIG